MLSFCPLVHVAFELWVGWRHSTCRPLLWDKRTLCHNLRQFCGLKEEDYHFRQGRMSFWIVRTFHIVSDRKATLKTSFVQYSSRLKVTQGRYNIFTTSSNIYGRFFARSLGNYNDSTSLINEFSNDGANGRYISHLESDLAEKKFFLVFRTNRRTLDAQLGPFIYWHP